MDRSQAKLYQNLELADLESWVFLIKDKEDNADRRKDALGGMT